MSILVTGAGGTLGRNVVEILLEKFPRKEIIIIDRIENPILENFAKNRNVIFFKTDLENTIMMDKIFCNFPIQSIIHLAFNNDISESISNPLKYYLNLRNTINLINFAVKHQVKYFIFSSTAEVYETDIVNEDSHKNPNNPYGKSKLLAEEILIDTCQTCSLKYVILRYPEILNCHSTISRDCIKVKDLAQAHVKSLEYLEDNQSEIFNIGYGILRFHLMFPKKENQYFQIRILDNQKMLEKLGDFFEKEEN